MLRTDNLAMGETGAPQIADFEVFAGQTNKKHAPVMPKLRKTIGAGMTIQEVRQFAQGSAMVKWCEDVEPALRKSTDDVMSQLQALIGVTQQDLVLLELADAIGPEDVEARKAEITRLTIQLERQVGMLGTISSHYLKLSHGGNGAIWAALLRQPQIGSPESGTAERNATPQRRFGQARDAQVIDAE